MIKMMMMVVVMLAMMVIMVLVINDVVGVLEVSDLEPALQSAESFCKLDQTRPRGQLRSFFRFC